MCIVGIGPLTPGIFGVMIHAANEIVNAIVARVDEGVFALHDGHKSESRYIIKQNEFLVACA